MTDRKTVGDLIKELSEYPADMPVLISGDAEGNSYGFLSDTSEGNYLAYSEWDGGLVSDEDLEEDDDEDEDLEEEDQDSRNSPIKVCVIWPV